MFQWHDEGLNDLFKEQITYICGQSTVGKLAGGQLADVVHTAEATAMVCNRLGHSLKTTMNRSSLLKCWFNRLL